MHKGLCLRYLGKLRAVLAVCLIVPLPALAGDAAIPEPLGFSSDGTVFAFTETGRQDGSGFSYANVYAVDLVRDAWVMLPVRIVEQDELGSPLSIRAAALTKAEGALGGLNLTEPARLLYARQPGFPQATSQSVDLRWRGTSTPGFEIGRFEIVLETFVLQTSDCDIETLGFALSVHGEEIARDGVIPASRNCPYGYSIERVFAPDGVFPTPFLVALIGVYKRGFEGADLRHIAIPIPVH